MEKSLKMNTLPISGERKDGMLHGLRVDKDPHLPSSSQSSPHSLPEQQRHLHQRQLSSSSAKSLVGELGRGDTANEELLRHPSPQFITEISTSTHGASPSSLTLPAQPPPSRIHEQPIGSTSTLPIVPKLHGILHKWTNYAGGWKRRYFVLDNCTLSYAKSERDLASGYRGMINITNAKVLGDPHDKKYFVISARNMTSFHLRAESYIEREKWIAALRAAKLRSEMLRKRKGNKNEEVLGSIEKLRIAGEGEQGTDMTSSGEQLGMEYLEDEEDEEESSDSYFRRVYHHSMGKEGSEDFSSTSLHHLSGAPRITLTTGDELETSRSQEQFMMDDELTSALHALYTQRDALEALFGTLIRVVDGKMRRTLELTEETTKSSSNELGSGHDQLLHDNRPHGGLVVHPDDDSKSVLGDFPIPLFSDTDFKRYFEMFRSSSQTLTSLLNDVIERFRDRELAWQKRLEKEARRRCIFEESLKVLATENTQLEESVEESGTIKRIGQMDAEITTDQRKTITLTDNSDQLSALLAEESAMDDTDQFFDALETLQRSGSRELMMVPGYLYEHRTVLPVKKGPIEINVWSVIKDAIGKDLTKISMPVSLNEPLSMLQRLCEDLEYSHLLDKANTLEDSIERMQYVAAFAMSNYSSTVNRTGKPFNPLLGETYELVKLERGFWYIAEQVSHHPPISACYCDSDSFEYWADTGLKNRFWGKSLEIIPLGYCHVVLKRFKDAYSWKKVTTCVHNLIVGTIYVDHYGEMEITNHKTNDRCVLKFLPRGWRGRNSFEVNGIIYDKEGRERCKLFGRWNDKLFAVPVGEVRNDSSTNLVHSESKGSKVVSSSSPVDSTASEIPASRHGSISGVLWRISPRIPNTEDYFNFTKFSMELNELSEELRQYLPGTDSRLRPDQAAYERGDRETATREKNRLESAQRSRRFQDEENDSHWEPRWFRKGTDPITGVACWIFNGSYWQCRKQRNFPDSPRIFDV